MLPSKLKIKFQNILDENPNITVHKAYDAFLLTKSSDKEISWGEMFKWAYMPKDKLKDALKNDKDF